MAFANLHILSRDEKEVLDLTTFKRVTAAFTLLALALVSFGAAQPGVGDTPDLIISNVELSPASPKPGDELTITLTIENQGEGDVASSARFGVEFLVSFGPKELSNLGLGVLTGVRIDKTTVTQGIDAGESIEVSFNWEVLQLPKFSFVFKVDSPFDDVRESDEGNNRTETTVAIPTRFLDQWWLDQVKAPEAQEITPGSPETVVAVIDTGMDLDHAEFQGNLWTNPENGGHGFDFIDDRIAKVRRTPIGVHGTGVAGTIAARDDGDGTTGLAPNVQLMDLRVFPTIRVGGRAIPTGATFEHINAAIRYATEHGADVINLSLGTSFCSVEQISPRFQDEVQRILDQQHEVIREAVSQGVVVVAAAGNNGQCVEFPSKFPEVIAVGATSKNGEITGYSGRGPEVWVTAPGGSITPDEFFARFEQGFKDLVPVLDTLIMTPYLRDNYGWFSGTSFSTPIVSGVVALMLSANPDLTPDDVREVLAATATDLGEDGRDDDSGHGLVNAVKALKCVRNGLNCI